MAQQPKQQDTELVKREATPSERFAAAVQKHFMAEVGELKFTDAQRTLAQHLFIKIDAAMATFNADIKDGKRTEISWNNVNMVKLAIDAVNRVQLGVDALIPGHLYPIPYFNGKTIKYDLDLRVGYKGELFYKQKASLRSINNIRVELVYDTDVFEVCKYGLSNKIEGYNFSITQPFERGNLVGGFGYIEYENERENELVVLSKAEIDQYKGASKSEKFWTPWYNQMAYKTLVRRVTDRIVLDPEKISVTALAKVEADEQRTSLDSGEGDYIVGDEIDFNVDEAPPASTTADDHAESPVDPF